MRCGGCRSEFYCSPTCQKARWSSHKKECKQIQAEMKQLEKGRGVGGSGVGGTGVGGRGVGGSGRGVGSRPTASVERYQDFEIGLACFHGHQERLQKVLAQRNPPLNVNWPQEIGETAVHAVAQSGYDKCLMLLITHGGADLSRMSIAGFAPIHVAIKFGRMAVIAILLDHGVDLDIRRALGDRETPALLCAGSGHVKCLALLIDRGADIKLKSLSGVTPAHMACAAGHLKCLQLLIARGAELNAIDAHGFSPLGLARSRGYTECVDLLIESNASSVRGDFGEESLLLSPEVLEVRLRIFATS
jgi:ankyrin repeat protein